MVFAAQRTVLMQAYFAIFFVTVSLRSIARPLSEWNQELEKSVEKEDADGCRQALAHGANVNLRGPLQQTLLMYACNKHEVMVPLLLGADADVHLVDRFKKTALMHTKSVAVAKALLDKGARVEENDKLGWTALHWAVWHEARAVVELLLERQDCTPELSKSLLHVAAGNTRSTMLEDLLAVNLPSWREGLQELSSKQRRPVVERARALTAELGNYLSAGIVREVKECLLTREQWECIENLALD